MGNTSQQDREYIRQLEAENHQLKQQLHDITTQLSWMQTYHAGGMQAVIERGKQAEAENQALRNELANRDRMLPVNTLFSSIELAPDASEIEKEAYERGVQDGTLQMDNTLVGMVVFFRQHQTKVIGHRIDGLVFQGNPDEAFREIMPQVLATMQRVPTVDDIGNKSIEGLNMVDMVHILKELSPYWFLHKHLFNAKTLEQFDYYWKSKIASAIKDAGRQYEKRRDKAKRHFKKTIKDCFISYEKRINPAQYFTKVLD
jgi:hypothetical protein